MAYMYQDHPSKHKTFTYVVLMLGHILDGEPTLKQQRANAI